MTQARINELEKELAKLRKQAAEEHRARCRSLLLVATKGMFLDDMVVLRDELNKMISDLRTSEAYDDE